MSDDGGVSGTQRATRLGANFVVLRHYERAWWRGDLLGGLTVAAYLVPQVMSYAQIAGLAPVVGLWAIIASLTVYAFVGTSRQLSVGPESTTALMTASILGSLALGDPDRYATMAALLALLVGAAAVLGWLLRLGFLADLLSKPVLVGYMTGVAIVMITGQLEKLTGVPVDGASALDEVRSFLSNLDEINWDTLTLSMATLAFLIVLQRLAPKLPVSLIAVLLSTVAVAALSLEDHGVAVVGSIPSGLPGVAWSSIHADDLVHLIGPALGIAFVGYTDNMLVGRSFATKHGQRVGPNEEWFAMGATNVAAGLVGGMPVSSSGSRTVLADGVGSKTQAHSLVAVVVVALTVTIGGRLLEQFPVAALGAIVVFAALRLIDIAGFRQLLAFRWIEFAIAVAAVIGVIALGALYGVLVAVGLSLLDLVRRVARPHDGILGYVPGLAGMHDIDDYPSARVVPGLIVYRYDAPLFFVNAEDFKRRALESVDQVSNGDGAGAGSAVGVEWFVLNAEAIIDVDLTAVEALNELRTELGKRGIEFAMARTKTDLRESLPESFLDAVGDDRIFATLPTAVEAYQRWYEERHGELPPGVRPVEPPPAPLVDEPPG